MQPADATSIRVMPGGNTLLSYQSTEFRNGKHDISNDEMVAAIGDTTGKNFLNPTKLFHLPARNAGLWNSITVLKDTTIVALTSTNVYNGNYGV